MDCITIGSRAWHELLVMIKWGLVVKWRALADEGLWAGLGLDDYETAEL